ncbi:hypothetical protein KR018_001518, partial [Drosophila ironensis]
MDLISQQRFPVETHQVVTRDGYFLSLFRIPYSPRLHNQRLPKPVVFLQHGLMGSSNSWVLGGRRSSLPYLLSDAGYDVWLGNSRGNLYGRRHSSLTPQDSEFWKFSFHEIGVFDLTAQIDYVLKTSEQQDLHFVGHSQAAADLFVMLAEKPEYNHRLRSVQLMAPLVFATHMKSELFSMVSNAAKYMKEGEYTPSTLTNIPIVSTMCSGLVSFLCRNIMLKLLGGDSNNIPEALKPKIANVNSMGVSNRLMKHIAQTSTSDHFTKYNFGQQDNQRLYGQNTPPDYNLLKVSPAGPIYVYYSRGDALVGKQNVGHLMVTVPNIRLQEVSAGSWNHLDFMFASNADDILYKQLLANMGSSPMTP